ncbi:MAG: SO_0444 family Cu/Zn efflux transporter [Acidobacteriota bacterium]
MEWLWAIPGASWIMLVQAAPYIVFGLAVAGLMHVLLPESLVLRWMGSPGLGGVIRAAIIGVPLPVCSCGVVPIAVELRRKGASRPASQSFLITTPESSIDSIFLTWGMMGPVMAIARPIAAFFTAVLGGILAIASARSVDELLAGGGADRHRDHSHDHGHDHDHDHSHDHDHDHDHHHHHHHHGHDHDHSHSVAFAGSARARLALRRALSPSRRRTASRAEGEEGEADRAEAVLAESVGAEPLVAESAVAESAVAASEDAESASLEDEEDTSVWRDLVKPAANYGFGELLDDLAFWLVVGIGLAGVLTVLLPDNLDELGLGTGLLPMIGLLIVGIPLYMCASASTPIAAALMLKGVSPGAALVFLLAGPATNAATVLLLVSAFGRRFVWIYVISVAVGALAAGLMLDFLLGGFDLTEGLRLSAEAGPGPVSVILTLLLVVLLARSLWRGAWAAGVEELSQALQRMRDAIPGGRWLRRRHLVTAALLLATLAYAFSGLRVVPTGSQGYGFVFGSLVRSGLEPGLHYLPPAPFGRWEMRRVEYPRKSDIGFRTDLSLIERRRELAGRASQDEWHSPVAAMNTVPTQASYLTGDGSLVELSFSVHYRLTDPEAFFFGVDHSRDFVNLYAEAEARELLAGLPLDELLTERRVEVENSIRDGLQTTLDEQGLGIGVVAVRIVDLHPPGDAVHAFRDVSSAKEDRETAIHRARADQARAIPRSRGVAAKLLADAEALAFRRQQEAQGENTSFTARAVPFGDSREVLQHLLWIETLERALAGKEKLIVPPGRGPDDSRGITLWQSAKQPWPPLMEHER